MSRTTGLFRHGDGFLVMRHFRNFPAAKHAMSLLSGVSEAAFEPVNPVRLEVALDAAEADDPPPHDGRLNLPRTDTGD